MGSRTLSTTHGTGKELSDLLRDELGIPKNVISFEVRFAVGELVRVRCEYLPEEPKRGGQSG
jgi:RNase P/RNase MRP subunit p29